MDLANSVLIEHPCITPYAKQFTQVKLQLSTIAASVKDELGLKKMNIGCHRHYSKSAKRMGK